VVAQKAATMQLLSDGRFTLGLGAGENLNEHIVGGRWPLAGVRHQMLAEAVEIIRALWAGGTVTYDPDEPTAVRRAMEQFRWFTGGWRVNAELPVPASFEMASRTVREADVATQMPCGPDLERHLAGIRQFEAAGFTHLALVQVGGDTQEQFISWAATELLPALRAS
jgi:hypothetical protein